VAGADAREEGAIDNLIRNPITAGALFFALHWLRWRRNMAQRQSPPPGGFGSNNSGTVMVNLRALILVLDRNIDEAKNTQWRTNGKTRTKETPR
jgi:hypothetical protein